MRRVKPEVLKVGDIIRVDSYDFEITHVRLDETEYVLSTIHYFFVWPVEGVMRVRADDHVKLKKGAL